MVTRMSRLGILLLVCSCDGFTGTNLLLHRHPVSRHLHGADAWHTLESKRPQRSMNPSFGKQTSTTSLQLYKSQIFNPTVLRASVLAIAKLLSSITIGALATPAGGLFGKVLDGTAVSTLSKLTYQLFQPCFLMVGVASTLGGKSSLPKSALWLLPLVSLLQIMLGAVAARIMTVKQLRPSLLGISTDDNEGANDIRMCTTFANSGPLPLILSEALFSKNGAVFSDVAACISFYLLFWSPLFWTFGRVILNGGGSDTSGKAKPLLKKVQSVLSPPVVGCLLGVAIGISQKLQKLFMTGMLSPLFGAAKSLGVAYLPAAVLVLAGSLLGGSNKNDDDSQKISPKTVVSVLLARFVLSPVLALALVKLLAFAKLLPTANPRAFAIVTFTLLMEGCMPPAQNSVILLQLDGKKERAAKMAKMLTLTYALSAIPVTLLLSVCLSLSGVMNFL